MTFRLPGNLAKVVATVDEMSGGRVEVGHRRRLARRRSTRAHGFAVPAARRALRHARGDARHHPRAVDRAGWLVATRHATGRSRDAALRERARARRTRPSAASSSAARVARASRRLAARYADEVNIVPRPPRSGVRRARTRAFGRPASSVGPRSGRAHVLGHGRRAGRRNERGPRGSGPAPARVHRARTATEARADGMAGGASRARWVIGHARRGTGQDRRDLRRAGVRARHAAGLPAARPRPWSPLSGASSPAEAGRRAAPGDLRYTPGLRAPDHTGAPSATLTSTDAPPCGARHCPSGAPSTGGADA